MGKFHKQSRETKPGAVKYRALLLRHDEWWAKDVGRACTIYWVKNDSDVGSKVVKLMEKVEVLRESIPGQDTTEADATVFGTCQSEEQISLIEEEFTKDQIDAVHLMRSLTLPCIESTSSYLHAEVKLMEGNPVYRPFFDLTLAQIDAASDAFPPDVIPPKQIIDGDDPSYDDAIPDTSLRSVVHGYVGLRHALLTNC